MKKSSQKAVKVKSATRPSEYLCLTFETVVSGLVTRSMLKTTCTTPDCYVVEETAGVTVKKVMWDNYESAHEALMASPTKMGLIIRIDH